MSDERDDLLEEMADALRRMKYHCNVRFFDKEYNRDDKYADKVLAKYNKFKELTDGR